MLVAFVPKNAHATTTVTSSDFSAQSFSKVVDYYDYVRAYAQQNNINITSIQNQHAYIYANYINVGGFQLFYAGLVNATHNNMNITIPIQTVFEHFKTPQGKDAITASSYLSLVSFQSSGTGDPYPDTPHFGDNIYASFSLGVNLTALTGHKVPSYVATSNIIPLTSTDSDHWTWGLNYTNLNSIWWRIYPDPLFPTYDASAPVALAQYSQLTFLYSLSIDPTARTATLTESYTVGQITDLWLLTTSPAVHLNSTGTYNLNGSLNSTQTVHQFLSNGGYRLSIVQSHTAILAGTKTTDTNDAGTSVDNDTSVDVTNTNVSTVATDGEKVFTTSFGAKSSYQLYNSTSGTQTSYNDNVRTVNRYAWGANPVFFIQNIFMGFLPLFVYQVDPGLFQAARLGMANFAVASYIYVITYPTWGGYKIVNDPQYTAFYQPSSGLGLLTVIFIAIAVAAGIGGVFAFLFARKRRPTAMTGATTTPNQPPSQSPGPMPGPSGPSQY